MITVNVVDLHADLRTGTYMHLNHDIVQKMLSSLLVFTSLMIVIELQSLYGSGLIYIEPLLVFLFSRFAILLTTNPETS